ncbi:MAG: PIN domain-containing protein [Alphaproteobacteria bacterium]|nr:PIN domain-containing protein [Alphaproteobacteria bacterium]
MTRYLLDTNIISDAIKPTPSRALADWMAAQVDETLYTSALTIAEIAGGILTMPAGRKRQSLESWFEGQKGPLALFEGRILAFDTNASLAWACVVAEGFAMGRPRSGFDAMIAAIAVANDCVVVTNNERHFQGLPVINPMTGAV